MEIIKDRFINKNGQAEMWFKVKGKLLRLSGNLTRAMFIKEAEHENSK